MLAEGVAAVALHQRVIITFGVPNLAHQYLSVRAVRCPDCRYRFLAAFEHGDPAGLLDVDRANVQLLDHARRSSVVHPTFFPPAAPMQRSA